MPVFLIYIILAGKENYHACTGLDICPLMYTCEGKNGDDSNSLSLVEFHALGQQKVKVNIEL